MKNLLLALLALGLSTASIAQEKEAFKPSGKVAGRVFWNYHYDMTKGSDKESAFELKRAYFGYKYNFSKNLSAEVTLDAGNNNEGSAYTVYVKKALLNWKLSSSVKVSLGIIGLEQFSDQEKFWSYRYIMKSYQDQYGFGSSADLGIKAKFKLSDVLSANAFIINGEGYKKVQDDDGRQKIGADLVLSLDNGFKAKVYYDLNKTAVVNDKGIEEDVSVSAFSAFIGYPISDKFRIAAEYNLLQNATKYSKPAEDQDKSGFSIYSTYSFNKKVEVFGRYDYLTSNELDGESENWNFNSDGSAIIGGVQYTPVKGVKMALNYQSWGFDDSSNDNISKLYANFLFKF